MTEIFLDTASVEDVKKFLGWGIGTGITTNQAIFLKTAEGVDFETRAKELLELAEGYPVSLEGPNDYDGIIKAALYYRKWGRNVVIKVPMLGNGDGLRAVKYLNEHNIKSNITACMTINQAFLAAQAGATYVSLFYNRMKDWKYSQLEPEWNKNIPKSNEEFMTYSTEYALAVIMLYMNLKEKWDFRTKLIVGSIRSVLDVEEILTAHPDIITIPTAILEKMPQNDMTDSTLADFDAAWQKYLESVK